MSGTPPMPPADRGTCRTCRFWGEFEREKRESLGIDRVGWCHRFSATTKGRPLIAHHDWCGEHRTSAATDTRSEVLPSVLADLNARVTKGAAQYGERLTTHNGRDALLDAYEEALDLALYLKQAILERDDAR